MNVLSTVAHHINATDMYWQIRTLKWDYWFELNVETTIGIEWISMLDIPPNIFAKEANFSIASVVGKPFIVDMATKTTQGLAVLE